MTRARIEYARRKGGRGRGGSGGRPSGGGGGRPSGGGGRGGGGGGRAAATSSARSAASTGSFTSANARALRQVGVSKPKIQSIRQASRTVANATAARAAMDPTVAGAMEAQANKGLNIGQQFYDSPDFQQALGQTGLTPQQVAEYAKSQGYGLGNQFMDQFGTTTADRSISDATKFREAMKIAAAQGKGTNLIRGGERKRIMKKFKNKTDFQFARSVDAINANKPDMMRIGLTGGVLNKLNRNKDGSLSRLGMMPSSDGFLGILANMNDRRTPGDFRNGVSSQLTPGTGKFRRGDTIYGLMSDGSFQQTPGVGKGWADTRFGKPVTTQYEPFYTPPEDTGSGPGDGDGDVGAVDPIIPEEEDKSLSSGAGGLDLASWATGFKRARSSRQKAGRGAQGLASQKKSPFTSWYK